jgi:dephospho-CoA kinase
MLRVGLTGGIACGKSLVGAFFRERGIPVVDDDQAARDAVAPGTPGLEAVIREFGPAYLLPDGTLDRAALGRLVFPNDELRRKLMQITFPFIGRLVQERIALAEGSGAEMMVYESALLIENGQAELWRPLVVVWASEERQLERLMARNALTRDEALARIRAQMPLAEKVALADYAIDNSGTRDATARRFEESFTALLERARLTGESSGSAAQRAG